VTETLKTRSDFSFEVRPAAPSDDAALGEFFAHVTHDDLRFRFLSAVNKVSAAQIATMTHVDHVRVEDFVVTEPGSGIIIANAMLAADKELVTAEVAISIHADYKGRGIGWSLLEHVARYAKARGIQKLQSIESRGNHAAIELEREMGFKAKAYEGDATLVLLEAELQS
jgi:acetyltransferase